MTNSTILALAVFGAMVATAFFGKALTSPLNPVTVTESHQEFHVNQVALQAVISRSNIKLAN